MHGEDDCGNELLCDNKKERLKHLKMVKKKQQVLIKSKGNYIEHWEKARYVSRHYKKYFQNIIDKDLKIKSWEQSNT